MAQLIVKTNEVDILLYCVSMSHGIEVDDIDIGILRLSLENTSSNIAS